MQSWPLEKKNCKLRFILDLKESWLNQISRNLGAVTQKILIVEISFGKASSPREAQAC